MENMDLFGSADSAKEAAVKDKGNIQFKDSFFRKLFSDKECLLDLYKTLHSEDRDVTTKDLELITIENCFFNDCYNDLGFRVRDKLIVLAEQQSTPNYNMPFRMLIYVAEEYKRSIDHKTIDPYREKCNTIPTPEFYVVYTGKRKFADELRLSDSFIKPTNNLELIVSVINEYDESNVLGCYKYLIDEVTKYCEAGLSRDAAIHNAITECFNLKNELFVKSLKNEPEVTSMLCEKFEIEEMLQSKRKEGIEIGREEGVDHAIKIFILNLQKQGNTDDIIIQRLQSDFGLSHSEALKYLHLDNGK